MEPMTWGEMVGVIIVAGVLMCAILVIEYIFDKYS